MKGFYWIPSEDIYHRIITAYRMFFSLPAIFGTVSQSISSDSSVMHHVTRGCRYREKHINPLKENPFLFKIIFLIGPRDHFFFFLGDVFNDPKKMKNIGGSG